MFRIARLVLAVAGVLLEGVAAACGTAASSQVVNDFPVPVFSFHGELASVAAASAGDAWAVGFSGPPSGTGTGTLMLHWDGATWGRVTSPGVLDGAPGMLTDVTAASAGDAWAVGFTGPTSARESGSAGKPLLLHWDGTRWSQAAGVPAVAGALAGIAVSGHSGWAVGTSWVAGHPQPLVLRWDGTRWHRAAAPAGPGDPELTSVVATPEGTAWAIGNVAQRGSISGHGMVLRWDGRSWHWASAPVAESPNESLRDVAAGSDGTVWAVGLAVTATSSPSVMRTTGPPLSMRWTGAAWQAVPVPGAGAGAGFLGVTLAPGGEVWAVGGADDGVMAMRWTGTAWARVPFPAGNGPQASGTLTGAAFSSSKDGWAVGTRIAGNETWPLILHWDGTAWN